jgi:hypothetical protein
VTVFPRVWVPEKTRFDPDLQRLGGKEWAEFEIACPSVMVEQKAPVATTKSPTLGTGKAATASTFGTKTAGAIGDRMANEEEALAKLKLLFWRYLDWQQRLKVLVQADALPSSAAKPVPQTMERIALENARQQGKLPAIWDAMMQYVPEEKREANPFAKN